MQNFFKKRQKTVLTESADQSKTSFKTNCLGIRSKLACLKLNNCFNLDQLAKSFNEGRSLTTITSVSCSIISTIFLMAFL